MGFSGNNDPSFIIPTEIATNPSKPMAGKRGIEDLDYFIGDEAKQKVTYSLQSPVKQGQVENWDLMEKYLQSSIFE